MRLHLWGVLAPVLAGCGSAAQGPLDVASDAQASVLDATEAGDVEVEVAATLALDCVTTVGAGVPPFFAAYFRCAEITVVGDRVVFKSDGLPPHPSYYYGAGHPQYAPFDTGRGPQYKPNPNLIAAQSLEVSFPLDPAPGTGEAYKMGTAGMALDGVALYNPLAAPGHDIEEEKYTFDSYSAHPDPQGRYHYHTTSAGPLEVLANLGLTQRTQPGTATLEIYGVMCDGTLVIGCTELDGTSPSPATLDTQGGHAHAVSDGKTDYFADRYHVHLCPDGPGGRRFTPEKAYYQGCVVKE